MSKRGIAGLLAVATVAAAMPAHAKSTYEYFVSHARDNAVPHVLSDEERTYYRSLFEAIHTEQWTRVQELFAQRSDGPLHPVARAEYYVAANSPRVELATIIDWMRTGYTLPQAAQLSRLALKRGGTLTDMPALPEPQSFNSLPGAPKRVRPSSVNDGTMPAATSAAILERIKNDDPFGAKALLDQAEPYLSDEARTEWRQRVAWSFYIENNDASAMALAEAPGNLRGAWFAEIEWVAGLAAWRQGYYERAADHFEMVARRAYNEELAAAGFYWAARANIRTRKPEKVKELLKGAADKDETLYGMLAAEQLGKALPETYSESDFDKKDWDNLKNLPNVRMAVGLVEVGEIDLASEVLRHQARIGDSRQFDAISRLARDFGMPNTQLWMAYNAPPDARPDPSSRYPTPKWQPVTGWLVDPALVYAHALQESNFRAEVVSPAGARGLMQIMPGTARYYAPSLNMSGSSAELARPEINLAFGQRTLQALKVDPATRGQLPKIMAAYNAGLTPVGRWNSEIRDQGDPLTWIESIPYWETRGYVAIVTRNYWMYERQAKAGSKTRKALAENDWPKFPEFYDRK